MKPQVTLWSKLDPAYLVTEEITRFIDGRRVVSSSELMKQWGISNVTLRRYTGLGMPKHPASSDGFLIFDLLEVGSWRLANITSRGAKPSKPIEDTETDDDYQGELGDTARKVKADADRAVEDALSARLKRQQLEGSLIESDTLDIAQAEMAVVYSTLYQNDKRTFPVQLLGKDSAEIRSYLDDHYANRMEDLQSLMVKEFPSCDATLYDIIHVVLQQLQNGVPPDAITYSLQGI